MGLDTEEISNFGPKGIAMSAISKYFSISSDHFSKLCQVYPDLKSLFSNLLESSEEQRTFSVSFENREEVLRWLTFADDFHADPRPVLNKFKDFDENLSQRSVLGGSGLCPSIVDIVVFAYLHDSMLQLPQSEWKAFSNILRWFDYIQNKVDFAPDFEKIRFEKSKFIPLNRKVLVVTNVKPGKLRDVMSSGLVLCASSEDHTVVEPLLPPEGAKIGEQVTFSGYKGKPEEILNPKKKRPEKISANLDTDADGVAMYKGVPFMTSAGPCRASLPNASIK